MPASSDLIRDLRRELGDDQVRDDAASRVVYARDASRLALGVPLAVVLPRTVTELGVAIATCARHDRPFVVRGAATGLAGGVLPPEGAVVIATSRLVGLGPVDAQRRRVHAEPGVLNEAVSRLAAPCGLYFAPDPSSQAAATIGGNIATNAGGPRCLKVGVMSRHVRRLDWFDASGRRWSTGQGGALDRGIDLRGLLCGSEGTLGVVCGADLDLLPLPEAEITLLAEFTSMADAAGAVVRLMGSGIEPLACEIVDQGMLAAVEAACPIGLARDAAAVMICELAGAANAVAAEQTLAIELLRAVGARRVEAAVEAEARAQLWRARKLAFGAVGRLAPASITMDVVVPLAKLAALLEAIASIAARHDVAVATALHAGDGNVHPSVQYDDRDADHAARAHRAADAIVLAAVALEGSITGEHGIGLEKRHLAHHQLDPTARRLLQGIKDCFDPAGRCNAGKALPAVGQAAADEKLPVVVPGEVSFDRESLTVTAPAAMTLAELQSLALAQGFWVPVGAAHRIRAVGPGLGGAMTLGAMIDAGTTGPSLLGSLRPTDAVLELWAETGAGELLHTGAAVLKNAAGYDLVRLLVGSGGMLARPLATTLLLRPAPADLGIWIWQDVPSHFSGEGRREFLEILRRHGQPSLAVRERSAEGPALWVLASGRHRDRDLERLAADLEVWSEDHGLGRPRQEQHPFAALCRPEVLADLPAWASAASNWTLLTSREDRPEWPHPRRLVWQSMPEMLWMPETPGEEPVGWFTDTVFRDGRLQPPPAPPVDVPRWLLGGLKRLFDPEGVLPCPDWLQAALAEEQAC